MLIIVASKKGIERIINLINNKFRTTSKFDQINNNILASSQYLEYSKTITLSLNTSNNLENHWLAGFSDADASFQIKLINRNNKTEVRLNYQIDQKKDYILILVKEVLGGNIGYRKTQDTYYYGSTSFGSFFLFSIKNKKKLLITSIVIICYLLNTLILLNEGKRGLLFFFFWIIFKKKN